MVEVTREIILLINSNVIITQFIFENYVYACKSVVYYNIILVVGLTTFFFFPFLGAALRAVSLVRPVPLIFSLCCAVWFGLLWNK